MLRESGGVSPAVVRVKVCGITTSQDALQAAAAGAAAIGLVFARGSPRRVTLVQAKRIADRLPPWVTPVGVFVNEPLPRLVALVGRSRVGCLQLHGQESPAYCRAARQRTGRPVIKAFRIASASDLKAIRPYRRAVDAILLDTVVPGRWGGTGRSFDRRVAVQAKRFGLPVILAGGLRPETVASAIRRVRPSGVDVSSGVERRPGAKDPAKVRAFLRACRSLCSLPGRNRGFLPDDPPPRKARGNPPRAPLDAR